MPRAVKIKSSAAVGPLAKKAVAGGKRNKLYSRPEPIAEGTILTDLSKAKWRIGPSIGTGGFGEIYSACRVGEKSYDYVVKCEPHGNGPLFVEMHFYMRNAKIEDIEQFKREHGLKFLGMPYMIGNGSEDIKGQKHRFIVMPRYGSDIGRYFLSNGRRFPEGTIYRLALQMLDVYEFIHNSGYVHADLKGANILLGYGKNGGAQTFLVDYGLASHYTTKDFKPDPKKMHNGTIEYTSRDAHLGVPTMRSDLEILGYNLIEWMGVQLPWVKEKLLATPAKVQKSKEGFMMNIGSGLKKLFPNGVPVPLGEFMMYVAKMDYKEEPDYNKCRKIFSTALKTMNIANSGDLDFKLQTSSNSNTIKSTCKTNRVYKANELSCSATEPIDKFCISDDSDDTIFEKKTPVKSAPNMTKKTNIRLKTRNVSPLNKLSPIRKVVSKISQNVTSPTCKVSPKYSPPTTSRKRQSPRATTRSESKSPTYKTKTSRPMGKSTTTTPQLPSTHRDGTSTCTTKQSTPISAKANINFSPSISIARSASSNSRPGKTIINDGLTPNTNPGKTYEFNFELDVSMDANVIVNVKRKKKPHKDTTRTASNNGHHRQHHSRETNERDDESDTPVTRVKVRKIATSESADSPRTPAVTVRKTKRVISPR